MTEELDQLLRNLHLRRVREIYDEQVRAAEKEDASYAEFLARPSGRRPGVAHPARQPAGTLVAGDLSLCPPARRQPQTDAHLGGVGVPG